MQVEQNSRACLCQNHLHVHCLRARGPVNSRTTLKSTMAKVGLNKNTGVEEQKLSEGSDLHQHVRGVNQRASQPVKRQFLQTQ